MSKGRRPSITPDLRKSLETARLDLLALFRALDRSGLTEKEIPQTQLHELFELDADFAEALFVMDNPPPDLDMRAMLKDTLASLEALPEAIKTFYKLLPEKYRRRLDSLKAAIRSAMTDREAYHGIRE